MVAVSLTLSFQEMQLLDCDVAFVEMMDKWKGGFLGVMGQAIQEDATRSPSDIGRTDSHQVPVSWR